MENFKMDNFVQRYGVDEHGVRYKKIYINYVDHETEPSLCDCCNETKQCAHFFMLCGDASIICKSCLKLMSSVF